MKDAPGISSLAAEAYTIVRTRILRGELALGEVVSRRKLAAELGMSFLPVSEALLRLEVEGLLESRPRAGTRVRIPSADDVRGHYVVREALEVQAARLFTAAATPAERRDLRVLATRVDALASRGDRSLYLAVHQTLHRRIAECTRCEPLCEAIERTHAVATIWLAVLPRPQVDDPRASHQRLVEVLAEGGPADAADAVRAHLAVGMERTLHVLEPYFQIRRSRGTTFVRSPQKIHRLVPRTIN